MQTAAIFSNIHGQISESIYTDQATIEYIANDIINNCSSDWDYAIVDDQFIIEADGTIGNINED